MDKMSYLTSKQIHEIAKTTMKTFRGDARLVEAAIGSLYLAKEFGWRPVYLIHDKKTLRKYEQTLGVKFRDDFPDVGPRANDSLGYLAVQKVSNFWKAVKGEIPGIRSPTISTEA